VKISGTTAMCACNNLNLLTYLLTYLTLRYIDSAGNTVEENSIVFSLIQMR